MRNLFISRRWILPLAFASILSHLLPNAAAHNQTHSNVPDSQLSASERNRRLIPYMAFYLPAPELPINQQYAKHQADASGATQLQAPSAGRIPVPIAYMPQSHSHPHAHHGHAPGPAHHQHHHHHHQQQQQQQQHHYQSNAGELYHHHSQQPQQPLPPVVTTAKELPQSAAHADASGGATFIAYKPLHSTQKHKTVQHFPPLAQQQQQQQPQQFELLPPPLPPAQFHRQRGKQSKINLTPFTPQNTLPGQFVPIIYTPVSNGNNNEHQSQPLQHNGNTINYNNKPAAEIVFEEEQQQQHQQQQHQVPQQHPTQHKNLQQTQIATDYAEDSSGGAAEAPAPVAQPTPSIYHSSYSAASASPPSASSASKPLPSTALIIHQKSSPYTSSKYESYFNMAPPSDQQLTPQEKYVLYLQQRMKYHKQHQQPSTIFIASSTSAPYDTVGDYHQHGHSKANKHSHSQLSHAQSLPHTLQQAHKYNNGQQQQVLHIPLRAIMGHVHDQLQQPQSQQPPRHEFVKEAALGTPGPTQFIDFLIDGPRQSLEEEHPPQLPAPVTAAPRPLRPNFATPQHAYILVTTSAPHTAHPPAPQLHELSTPRPPLQYPQQPTLRLKPVTPTHKYKATRRPVFVSTQSPRPSQTVDITPKYVYAQSAASREPPTATPIKLKPSYKYEHVEPPAAPKPITFDAEDQDQLPDIHTSSLTEILHKLQASNHLPQTLTPDNIDNSIKTLIKILQNLKQTQNIVPNPPQHHETPASNDYEYHTGSGEQQISKEQEQPADLAALVPLNTPNKHPGPSTGRPGIDYPNYSEIPKTNFDCTEQRYKGFFGDPETSCQVWHYCDLNGGKASFLCPNGTIFSQIALTCDWWFNVKCSTTAQLYVLNERLYKYILPFNPKFPEDYNGPIVDKYLAMKFQEMEEKMRVEKQRKSKIQAEKPTISDEAATPPLPKNHKPSPKLGSGINAQVYEQSSERNLLIDDEIDDISERGTYDTYEQQPTTLSAPTTAPEARPFHKPIVVSSTPEPQLELESLPESAEEDKLQSLRDTSNAQKQLDTQTTRQTTKVSVEKLEVIEIKTDGNTGQLMPVTELPEYASGSGESSEQTRE